MLMVTAGEKSQDPIQGSGPNPGIRIRNPGILCPTSRVLSISAQMNFINQIYIRGIGNHIRIQGIFQWGGGHSFSYPQAKRRGITGVNLYCPQAIYIPNKMLSMKIKKISGSRKISLILTYFNAIFRLRRSSALTLTTGFSLQNVPVTPMQAKGNMDPLIKSILEMSFRDSGACRFFSAS